MHTLRLLALLPLLLLILGVEAADPCNGGSSSSWKCNDVAKTTTLGCVFHQGHNPPSKWGESCTEFWCAPVCATPASSAPTAAINCLTGSASKYNCDQIGNGGVGCNFFAGHAAPTNGHGESCTSHWCKSICITRDTSAPTAAPNLCEVTAMDIVFVMDETASVNPTELEEIQQFAKAVLGNFVVGEPVPNLHTQIGVLTYAFDAVPAFDLGTHDSNGAVAKAIDLLPTQYGMRTSGEKEGWCCHGTAMLAAATQFKWRPAAERVIVYIMDGMNTQIGLGCVEENNRVGNLKLMKDTVDRVVPIAVVNTLPNVLFKIVSGAEHVSIDEVGCVTDGAGDHAANEKSEMKILVDGLLYTQFLDTGDCWVYSKYDYLQLNDNYKQVWQCHTEDGPDNVPVKAGDKLTWTTDGHAHGAGFVVCLTPDVVLTTEPKTEKVADEFLMSMSKGMPAWQPFFSVETFAELNTDEVIQQAQSITCGVHDWAC